MIILFLTYYTWEYPVSRFYVVEYGYFLLLHILTHSTVNCNHSTSVNNVNNVNSVNNVTNGNNVTNVNNVTIQTIKKAEILNQINDI